MHTNFAAQYPLSTQLGLRPVQTAADVEHAGFDIDDVEKALGTARFQAFSSTLKQVFSCGHRNWDANHPEEYKRNAEVHCVYAEDLERFLEAHPVPKVGG